MKIDIYVINLSKRPDRLEHFNKTFQNHFNIIRIEAIENKDGAYGCFLSHIKCIKLAKDLGLKNIIVMEDYCVPFDSIDIFYQKVHQIKNFLDNFDDFNIFLGCANKLKHSDIVYKFPNTNIVNSDSDSDPDSDLYLISHGKTTHFIIYNHKIYDFYLNSTYSVEKSIDKVWHGQFNAITILPFICSQINDYSDIENKLCSYSESFLRYQRKLLKSLNKKNLN